MKEFLNLIKRKKSLESLTSKLILTGKGGGFAESIKKLREAVSQEEIKKGEVIDSGNMNRKVKNDKSADEINNSSEKSSSIWEDDLKNTDGFRNESDLDSQDNSW